jgi:hypothetical protein
MAEYPGKHYTDYSCKTMSRDCADWIIYALQVASHQSRARHCDEGAQHRFDEGLPWFDAARIGRDGDQTTHHAEHNAVLMGNRPQIKSSR